MLHGFLQVLLYAVLAGLSPLAFAATIAVMRAGRPQALAFGVGFVAAQAVTFAVFLVIKVGISGRTRRSSVQVVVELALAAALVWLARATPRLLAARREATGDRTHRLLERLGRVRVGTALGAGVLLGVGGVKRLVITALAANVTTAGFGTSARIVLGVIYVAIATALVWAAVVVYLFFGQRAVGLMNRAQEKIAHHQPKVSVYALLLLAALFAVDALATLLTR